MSQHYPPPHGQQPNYPGPYGYPQPPYFQAPPPPQVGSAPLAPYRLGSIFSAAWHNIAKNPAAALGMPALLTFAGYALMILIMLGLLWVDAANNFAILGGLAEDSVSDTEFAAGFQALMWTIFLVTTVAMIPMIMLSVVTQAVTVPVTARDLLGLRTSFTQGLRLIRPVMGKVLLLGLLYSLVTALVMLLLFGSLVLVLGQALEGPANVTSEEYMVTAIPYFLAFVFIWVLVVLVLAFLSLFLLVRFAFVTAAVVLEGLGPFAAIRRSWTLITGRYWPVLGTFLLFSLIVSVISQAISMVIAIPTATVENRQDQLATDSPEFMWGVVALVIMYGLQLAITAFLTVYQTMAINNMYFDLRFRKEALAVELTNTALNDPVLQSAARQDPQALEQTKDYLPGETRSLPASTQ